MKKAMSKRSAYKVQDKMSDQPDPFKLRSFVSTEEDAEPFVHIIRKGVRCDTERRGRATPEGRSPLEIVLDATEGFIPLWAEGSTLRWRFRHSSFQVFDEPEAAKAGVEQLLGEALLEWGDSAPVKFTRSEDAWDFEIVVRAADDCTPSGCVLASAFFPDAGRHKLVIYPKMFTQSRREQVETMIHEIGHIFGLRHFFALVDEAAWPAVVFGKHSKFSIMNYGASSRLTAADKSDLKALYQSAWAGELTKINGTPIKFVKPFHESGDPADILLAAATIPTGPRLPRKRARA